MFLTKEITRKQAISSCSRLSIALEQIHIFKTSMIAEPNIIVPGAVGKASQVWERGPGPET